MSKIYATSLYYCFELKGVLNDFEDKESVIQKINSKTYQELLAAVTISAGMLPKLENCFDALQKGVAEVRIGDTTLLSKENNLHTKITL
jgi:acetylglutamate kinase